MKIFTKRLLPLAMLGLIAATTEKAPKDGGPQDGAGVRARGAAASVKVSFIVQAIDVERRLIALKGPRGNVGVYQVGEQVKRLGDIKVGDTIKADYQVAAIAELREPTVEELENPMVVSKGIDRAPAEGPPAATLHRAIRIVTKIEAVDKASQTFTVKGPLQGVVTIHVDDAATFAGARVGRSIVVSFAEALTLSVEPGPSVVRLRGVAASMKASVTVMAIDGDRRLIALRGPRGNVGVFQVGEQVKRLSEIKPGDTLEADYQVTASAELREPTDEELENPLVISKGLERAPSDSPPAATLERAVRIVARIESVDPSAQEFTVKGPLHGMVTIHVDDPAKFAGARVGRAIVVSFEESLTLTVEPGASTPRVRGAATGIRVALSVEAVDPDRRLIALKGARGNVGVFQVGDQVKRLSEIKVGDTLTADYRVAATAELREPSTDELANPLIVAKGLERGPSDSPPAAALDRAIRVVVKIDGLDPVAQEFTVKGPLGGAVTFHVDDPTAFAALRVGQPIVVSYSETLTLIVEKGSK
jgi:hypothetical protein